MKCYYIDDIPCFTADGVCNLEVVVCTFGGALNIRFGIEGSACQAVITASLISGGAFRAGRGSQRRVRSRSILYTIFPHITGSTKFVVANRLSNSENVPSLEVLPRISTPARLSCVYP